jgi:phosphoribosylformimino-5-aminoimidazole carboxamide ribotide isomerase
VSSPQTSTFEVIPAIDLRGGRVVRLERGDFDRETTFGDDPAEQARAFAGAGVRWIHVVDLDGARDGRPRQTAAVAAIVAAAGGVAIEVAGGLRTAESVAAALDAGAARIVLGTVAITDPELVAQVVARHGPEAIAVALDVRDGQAVGGGWLEGSPARDVSTVIEGLAGVGVRTWIVTAIDRDGLLGGPDLELLAQVVAAGSATVIASGGVTTLDDLHAVRRIGCGGAIVGRAIYDGRLDLAGAIRALRSDTG